MAHPKRRQSKTRTAKRRTHNGTYITLYVVHVAITEENLL